MPAVDQDRQPDRARATQVDHPVERRADRPPRVEDVVAQQHRASVQVEVDLGLLEQGLRRDRREIVPIEGDVEGADRERVGDEVGEAGRQTRRQRHSPRPDADQRQAREVLLTLRDLVGHPIDHAPNAIGVQDLGFLDQLVRQIRASVWGRGNPVKERRRKGAPKAPNRR